MGEININWTLFWQIAGPIIALLGIIIMVVLFLWPRREKVKINVTKPSYTTQVSDRVLRVFWSGEIQRFGGQEVHYVAQICLKPDAQIYQKLQKYFKLPQDGVIIINKRLAISRGNMASFGHGDEAAYPEYEAFVETGAAEEWEIARQLASALSQKAFKVRLVWEDGGKTKWKTIKQQDHGWITL